MNIFCFPKGRQLPYAVRSLGIRLRLLTLSYTVRGPLCFSPLMLFLATAIAVVLGGCRQERNTAPADDVMLQKGSWRAALTLPEAELPFLFEVIVSTPDAIVLDILNGEERIRVREVSLEGDSLLIRLPVYDSEIRAELKATRMSGFWYNYARPGDYRLPFEARFGETQRFPRQHDHPLERSLSPDGYWDVTFSPDTDSASKAIGIFRQDNERLAGTFLTETGDYRYLDGITDGSGIFLSCFDGAHAFLFTAEARPDGRLEGWFYSGSHWRERWTAERGEQLALPDPFALTFERSEREAFTFALPDLDGNIVSLSDDRFAGRALLVVLMGTWCPNCRDESAFLSSLYPEYKERGLSIVMLAYETSSDRDTIRRRIQRYKEHFDIDFDILPAGPADKAAASATLPMLNRISAYPTSLFIDRQGRVRRIYTGFSGPATGKAYHRLRQEFIRTIESLLAEDAPVPGL